MPYFEILFDDMKEFRERNKLELEIFEGMML
jgi:hypothetical protein